MLPGPLRSLTKAIFVPSGDQVGPMSLAGLLVSRLRPVPSALVTKMSAWPPGLLTKAICPRTAMGDDPGLDPEVPPEQAGGNERERDGEQRPPPRFLHVKIVAFVGPPIPDQLDGSCIPVQSRGYHPVACRLGCWVRAWEAAARARTLDLDHPTFRCGGHLILPRGVDRPMRRPAPSRVSTRPAGRSRTCRRRSSALPSFRP